jgi:uncharacterized DUF497 family protein
MELEWDERKRRETLDRRHLDFADVEAFAYNTVVAVPDRRKDYGEQRVQCLWLPSRRALHLLFYMARRTHAHHLDEESQ